MPLARFHKPLYCLLVACLFAFNFTAFTPGIMTVDSLDQLKQAQEGVYDDHHPPVMAALWRLLLPLSQGSEPMFLLQLALFWGAILLLGLTFIDKQPKLSFLFVLLWLPPPLMGMTADIWKDTHMAASWLMCAALLIHYQRREQRPGAWGLLFIAATFWYGLAVRYNAWTGAWPLLYWLLTLYSPPWQSALRRVVISGLLLALVGAGTWIYNARMSSVPYYMVQELYLQDLGCMSLRMNQPLFPPYITGNRSFSFADLQRAHPQGNIVKYQIRKLHSTDPEAIRQLQYSWQQAIGRFPSDYLACRFMAFNALYRLGSSHSVYTYELRRNAPPDTPAEKKAYGALTYYLETVMKGGPWNLPYYWGLLALVLAGWSFMRNHAHPGLADALNGPIFTLTLSGLLYLGGYFFMAWSGDMRYLYWFVMATGLATVLAVLEMAQEVEKSKRQ